MKNQFKLLIILCFISANLTSAQSVVTPSVYYTYGAYSNENNSKDYSGYLSIKLAARGDYMIAGYDKLLITNPDYEFDQKMFVAGIIKNQYPFYLKLNYANINGDYNSSLDPLLNYTDKTNVINGGILYNFDLYFIGVSYTYTNLNGLSSVNSNQIGADFIWNTSSNFILSIKPLYTKVSDGRSLVSSNIKFDFPISTKVRFSAEGSFGKRAYYFNPDLLTIYNQDETQKTTISVRGEYQLFKFLRLITSYQYAEFDSFNIKYIIGGLKFSL